MGTFTIKVIDSGAGISAEDQKRVFNEVVQFNPNELQAGGGSGLGLWISKRLCDLHNGRIGLHSEGVGKGCTFYVMLPLYTVKGGIDNDHMTHHGKDEAPSERLHETGIFISPLSPDLVTYPGFSFNLGMSFEGLKVLIVDDSPMILKMLSKILISKGAVCSVALNGSLAFDMVQETCVANGHFSCFDVILIDFIMPVCNGPTATMMMRSIGYEGLIFGLTGCAESSAISAFINAGANAVMGKPLDIDILEGHLCAHRNNFAQLVRVRGNSIN